ncbi:hypothetical protein ZIOFF_021093 [Zingiber officinale]|uniref:Uncharacterized protein n=1 Tax=Zingiber officinale TaxID=94328 RepID=A0A8J5L8A1_ZINOF|nr:hypothetical protein ZIOFF_021093 [Zingiber officinale]
MEGDSFDAQDDLDKFENDLEEEVDESELDAQSELFIHIIPDKATYTLSIVDNSIGMTKSDRYYCTIWHQGIHGGTCCWADIGMIGQFSVGFYSAYFIAKRIVVKTKHSDDEQYVRWCLEPSDWWSKVILHHRNTTVLS